MKRCTNVPYNPVSRAKVLPTQRRAIHGALQGVTERLVDTTVAKCMVTSRGGCWLHEWISGNAENGTRANVTVAAHLQIQQISEQLVSTWNKLVAEQEYQVLVH